MVARPEEPAAAPAVFELAAAEREEFMLRNEDWRPARPVVLCPMAEALAAGVMPAPAALVMVTLAIAVALLIRELKWDVWTAAADAPAPEEFVGTGGLR